MDEQLKVGWTVVLGVEAIQEGAQHTALLGADAQCTGREEMKAKSHSLQLVAEEVLYSCTCERKKAESDHF